MDAEARDESSGVLAPASETNAETLLGEMPTARNAFATETGNSLAKDELQVSTNIAQMKSHSALAPL